MKNLKELLEILDDAIARHIASGGDPNDPNTLVLTLHTPTTRGMGIRPIILEVREDGTRVIGVTAAVAVRWRKKISERIVNGDNE